MTKQLTYIKTEELIPYARNSRTHSDEQVSQLMASINEFGFTNPILVDDKKEIIAGHGRLLAAQRLGLDGVPCLVLDYLTDAQKKALVIADNKLALNAGWDNELLGIELKELEEMDFDLSLTGFDGDELAAFMVDEVEGLTDEDAVPVVPVNPVTVEGDVWQMKRQKNTVHPTMKPVELIDMAMVDHPSKKTVFDGFGGSGSTLISSEKNHKTAFLMELDPKYCDVIIKRWQDFTGKQAVHEDGSTFDEVSDGRYDPAKNSADSYDEALKAMREKAAE